MTATFYNILPLPSAVDHKTFCSGERVFTSSIVGLGDRFYDAHKHTLCTAFHTYWGTSGRLGSEIHPKLYSEGADSKLQTANSKSALFSKRAHCAYSRLERTIEATKVRHDDDGTPAAAPKVRLLGGETKTLRRHGLARRDLWPA